MAPVTRMTIKDSHGAIMTQDAASNLTLIDTPKCNPIIILRTHFVRVEKTFSKKVRYTETFPSQVQQTVKSRQRKERWIEPNPYRGGNLLRWKYDESTVKRQNAVKLRRSIKSMSIYSYSEAYTNSWTIHFKNNNISHIHIWVLKYYTLHHILK